MIHYYFKFGKGNEKFKLFLNDEKKLKEAEMPIPLSIYFGDWKANDGRSYIQQLNKELKELKEIRNRKIDNKDSFSSETNSNSSRQSQIIKISNKVKQIEEFYSIEDNHEETFFWIFYEDKVFCFKRIEDRKIHDGPINLIDENNSFPKSIDAQLFCCMPKHKLPAVFANINSNQKYNRGTIAKLENSEKEIANFLIEIKNDRNKPPIPINKDNFTEFLSPIEFETLIFLIINHNGSYCSSFRGGTLKDFDLKVNLSNLDGLPNGEHWIQVKKKDDTDIDTQKHPPNVLLIYNGKEKASNKIGKEWLIKHVDDREDIRKWLEKSTFYYPKIFNFSWD